MQPEMKTGFAFCPFLVRALFLSLALGCLAVTTCRTQDTSSLRIGTIAITRKEIFDTSDSTERHLLGKVANSIHFLTKERLIRNELLFREGDLYDSALVQESERNLRRLGIIGDVIIRPVSVDSGRVNVDVETHDKWTLNLNATYKEDGDIRNFTLAMSESNFLGNAQQLTLDYNYRSDRTNPHGMELRFDERRLMNSRWGVTLQLKEGEDLRIRTLLLQHPFYAEDTRWAASIYQTMESCDHADMTTGLYHKKVFCRNST